MAKKRKLIASAKSPEVRWQTFTIFDFQYTPPLGSAMRLRSAIVRSLLLCSLLPLAWAASPSPLDEKACREVLAAVARPPLLRADFVQEKTLPDVSRPLQASGELVVSLRHGVILRTLRPEFAKGSKVMPLVSTPPRPSDVEARIGYLIQSLLAADYAPLSELFSATGEQTPGRLRLRLVPRSGELRNVINSVELNFGEHLEEVRVVEGAGSVIRLSFSRFATGPKLTEAEIAEFERAAKR